MATEQIESLARRLFNCRQEQFKSKYGHGTFSNWEELSATAQEAWIDAVTQVFWRREGDSSAPSPLGRLTAAATGLRINCAPGEFKESRKELVEAAIAYALAPESESLTAQLALAAEWGQDALLEEVKRLELSCDGLHGSEMSKLLRRAKWFRRAAEYLKEQS